MPEITEPLPRVRQVVLSEDTFKMLSMALAFASTTRSGQLVDSLVAFKMFCRLIDLWGKEKTAKHVDELAKLYHRLSKEEENVAQDEPQG